MFLEQTKATVLQVVFQGDRVMKLKKSQFHIFCEQFSIVFNLFLKILIYYFLIKNLINKLFLHAFNEYRHIEHKLYK